MFKINKLISGEMGSVNLGGEENATSLVVHFLDSSIQVFRSIFTDAAISFFAVTIQVNVAKARGYLFANIPISLVTFAINLWAAISILRKERTGIHCLIVCDCVLNVVSSLHTSFLQSPWSLLGSSIPCLFSLIALNLLTAWNRLVPVAIAAFRYIMVCHAVFVQKHGGGKKVGWQ